MTLDLEDKGYATHLVPFEITSNGHIMKQSKSSIDKVMKEFGIRLTPSVYKNMSKISLLCTMSIFHAYQTKEWVDPPLLTP